MAEWIYAQTQPGDELAKLHFFSLLKHEPAGEVEFRITVRKYATRNKALMRFFAQTDKQTNQRVAPFTPCGWGETLLEALSECVKSIHRFPYQPQETAAQVGTAL